MTIALIHHHKAFLPALEGYSRFFGKRGIDCAVVMPAELGSLDRQVDWFFMGLDRSARQPGIFKIHEYISPSTPPLGWLKDSGKRLLNSRPDLRIFKNAYVQGCFNFRDAVPFCYQDIGLADEFLSMPASLPAKEFDFIYIGALSAERRPEVMLNAFTRPALSGRSLLVLGRDYEKLQSTYAAFPNIIFKGPVPRAAVKEFILRSRFGLNYIPDVAPFNRLTSTKLLEFAACGLPVVSTDYAWVRQFHAQFGGASLLVRPDLSDLDWERVTGFGYASPDLHSWTWDAQLTGSGVLRYLAPIFPEIYTESY